MKDRNYVDIFNMDGIKNATEDRKMKKFMRWAIPVLVIEVIALILIGIYFFVVPKNYCTVSINNKDAIIYLNNKVGNKVRLDDPKEAVTYYYYGVDLWVTLPGTDDYNVTFTVKCDKYKVYAATTAPKQDDTYSMLVVGGEKTQILTGITIVSEELIKNFDVNIEIFVEKI